MLQDKGVVIPGATTGNVLCKMLDGKKQYSCKTVVPGVYSVT